MNTTTEPISTTQLAIIQGTLGRRIHVERFKLSEMQQKGEVSGLSYQHGLVIGLLLAKEIITPANQETANP